MGKAKRVTKRLASRWITWWERDDAFRRSVVSTAAEMIATHLHDNAEIRKLEARAKADDAATLRRAVEVLAERRIEAEFRK